VFVDATGELMVDVPLYIPVFPFLLISHQSTIGEIEASRS
jgi:hypothetical protein